MIRIPSPAAILSRIGIPVLAAGLAAVPLAAETPGLEQRALEQVILPGYTAFAETTEALQAAGARCDGPALRESYQQAFDAWERVSFLRFGPSETEQRAFAIAFWPDRKGFTARSLTGLARDADPVVDDPGAFTHVSIAARGLFALDYLLYDPQGQELGAGDGYRCRLIGAITTDLHGLAAAILADWQGDWGQWLVTAGSPTNPVFPRERDAVQALFKALVGGIQFTRDLQLANPLGSYDRPRATRAEAWRSDRPLRNIRLSLAAQEYMALAVFGPDLPAADRAALTEDFDRVRALAARIDPPLTDAVADPARRFRVEALQTATDALYRQVVTLVGPALGVHEGFNAMDGD